MKTTWWAAILVVLGGWACEVGGLASDVEAFRRQVEADWLLQERYRTNQLRTGKSVPASADAPGGCVGV